MSVRCRFTQGIRTSDHYKVFEVEEGNHLRNSLDPNIVVIRPVLVDFISQSIYEPQ